MPLVHEPVPYLSETDWQKCCDPKRMLYFLCYHWRQSLPRWLQPAKTTSRKLRLFACACARLDPAFDDRRAAVELAERYADGVATRAELREAFLAQGQLRYFNGLPALSPYAYDAAYHSILHLPGDTVLPLVRDIFGNPYRPPRPDPSWLTRDVVSLARAVYSERAFDRLPELAVILEKGGCPPMDIVSHCRIAHAHARGCWALDLILGLR